jgi:hypothetical protein
MSYAEKLKDPRWQKKRLEVFERDEWSCQQCFDAQSTLHVHHKWYEKGRDPWDYPLESLITLCEDCHELENAERYAVDQKLIRAVRTQFLNRDVELLAMGFESLKLLHVPSVVAEAIMTALINPDRQSRLIEEFFAGVRKSVEDKG